MQAAFEASGGLWKEYRIGDLFDVKTTRGFDAGKLELLKKGTYEFIGRTQANYGVQGYLEKIDEIAPNPANVISVSQIGSHHAQLRHTEWYASQNIFILYPHYEELFSLYTIAVLNKVLEGYFGNSYTYYPTLKSLEELPLTLPTLSDGSIAFSYMADFVREQEADFVREQEADFVRELCAYLQATGLENYELTAEEKGIIEMLRKGEVKFAKFKVGEMFTCQTGDADIQRKHLTDTGTMYINSGVTNLGIIGRTTYPAKVFPANTITVDMFGNAYYRDFEYKMATHAHVFSLTYKHAGFNKYIGHYICTAMGYFRSIYSFSDMCNWTKMSKNTILLPVDKHGQIDYGFMETYIHAIEKLVIRGVVEWKDKIIRTTKAVIS